MNRVNNANASFTLKRSSLQVLIAILEDDKCSSDKVIKAISKIKHDKKVRYWDALLYLRMTMPGLAHLALPGGGAALGKTNAVLLEKTALPPAYTRTFPGNQKAELYKNGPDRFKVMAPRTRFLGVTVEQFIWEYHGKIGVFLIHMGKVVDGMDMIMNGKTCIGHIKSVLQVAAQKNANVLALHLFEGQPVCQQLQEAYLRFNNRTEIFQPEKHEGGDNAYFKAFAEAHSTCVVIGWDADVCAAANVLGSLAFDENDQLIAPIVSHTNVVTSRPLLITSGQIRTAEWGVLSGT